MQRLLGDDAPSIGLREALEQLLLIRFTHAETVVRNGTMKNNLTLVIWRVCIQVDGYPPEIRSELNDPSI
jgi:hypothetical protein